ncbi:kinase phosphorylation protein-domain-containing protein [Annulohypoxylon maeteangense]|uniref:kinase phosphorylation protein-domain-containing protein n=1 Tax=Annulohypoxylon maeteangense TaxID=1927788 RepID=UPI002008298E|nr:kinase phosphorylation protein-domain-containing protein [Annulohypoxylon maeteangense]KAI0884420.1 kinase phosphorylation protein-domain-containing protein [Annulohypoxylon maeteangense]
MDLVSSIRKTGSRGGVNFNWEDVANSSHRENYLGHSLKAPVGRWAKGKDLTWYAKGDAPESSGTETEQEKEERERKEELKRIKEAEEDALARALGLPVAPRKTTGANAVDVVAGRGVMDGRDSKPTEKVEEGPVDNGRKASKRHDESERRHRRRHRSRSRSRDRRRDRSPRRGDDYSKHRSRDDRDDGHGRQGRRDQSPGRDEHRHRRSYRRERSPDRNPERSERRRDDKDTYRPRSRDGRSRRSTSPERHRRRRSPEDRR